MRKIITICIIGLFALNVQAQPVKTLKLSDKELLDKIKGGWAGQTIGVVFGAPTEFKFTGTYIQDYQPIPWAEESIFCWSGCARQLPEFPPEKILSRQIKGWSLCLSN